MSLTGMMKLAMAFEIERKFLVKGDAWRGLAEPLRIRQGYLPTKVMAEHPFSEWCERKETK